MKLEEALKTTKFKNMRHKASLNVMYTAYWLKTQGGSLFKESGLTGEQYNVMRILKGKHPEAMCVKDIGSRMIEQNSNVPRIIDRLVAKKIVKRATSKEDKRETLITLTEDGLNLLETTNKQVDKMNERIIGLTEEEAGTLNELLEKMRAAQ